MNLTEIVIPGAMLITIFGAMLKYILWQNEKRMDERFKTLEDTRQEASKRWDTRYTQSEASMQLFTERLIKVEADLKHMPTHLEMQRLNNDLAQVRGENATQTELLKRVDRQVGLINEWMMENK